MVEPVACALDQPRLADRMRQWQQLRPTLRSAPEPRPDGVRLEFDPDPADAHRLLDLVAAERECCGWAEWTLTSTAVSTRLDVAADGAGVQALHAMFEATS